MWIRGDSIFSEVLNNSKSMTKPDAHVILKFNKSHVDNLRKDLMSISKQFVNQDLVISKGLSS